MAAILLTRPCITETSRAIPHRKLKETKNYDLVLTVSYYPGWRKKTVEIIMCDSTPPELTDRIIEHAASQGFAEAVPLDFHPNYCVH